MGVCVCQKQVIHSQPEDGIDPKAMVVKFALSAITTYSFVVYTIYNMLYKHDCLFY